MSAHPRADRRPHPHPHPHRPTPSSNRQEWVPRGPPAGAAPAPSTPPLLPTPGSEPAPTRNPPKPIRNHQQHRHHRPNPNPNPNRHRGAPPPPKQHHRSDDQEPSSSSSAAAPPPAEAAPAEVPQLVQEIEEKLSRGAVECMICYDMVRRSSPIWSCSSCFSLFHLHCIRKWSRSPTSAADSSSSSWRCPGCQSVQSIQSKDLAYTCFCGRRKDPPNDYYLTPHSCGEPCRKPLDRTRDSDDPGLRCPHVCVLQCHPGPCPPCKAFAPRRPCPCGKTTLARRCSDRSSPLTCGQRCDRPLPCGRHRCGSPCHPGRCPPCRVPVSASCFCKKRTDVLLCGDMAFEGELDGIGDGVFSCGSRCGRTLSCGNHQCRETCHPGPCGECELSPGKVRTCCCGKTELGQERKSCLDPVPTCSGTCDKMLPCGAHRCKETCHEGACPPCLVRVDQRCRCGSSHRMVECYVSTEEKDGFVCDKQCGRKKNCGRHRCSEKCCPLSKPGSEQSTDRDWDPHMCLVHCGKRLRCGQHSCQLLCHSGHCPPCLETVFSDLFCACGKTSIPPPIPCGTPVPSCPHPCLVPRPCGHSASHTCHFGDCPPCSIPVAKECIGGHVLLRNIPCGSKDIRCNQLCGKTRQCGMHACTRTCHPPPCDLPPSSSDSGVKSSCGQVCGAPRRDCRHTCTASCHPSSQCPDLKCEFSVTITCSCGRITATVPCGAGGSTSGFNMDAVLESSAIQKLPVPLQPEEGNGKRVPLGQRKLTCNEECEKLARKRQLAEAFDITNPNVDSLCSGESSAASDLLADLFRREPKWVLAVEERFKFLVLGKAKGATVTGLRVHVFCPVLKEKRDVIRQIAERWKLSIKAAGWEPKRFLVVHVTPKSKPPARIIGAKPGAPMAALHPPAFDPLIDMDPKLVVAMLELERDADISSLVLRFGGECELVWLNDKNALAVFSDPARAATALRRLDHGSAYQGAAVVVQNDGPSGSSNNAWGGGGGAKEGGSAPAKSGNPWKRALASESDSWAGEWSAVADAVVPVWRGNEAPPLSASVNRWNALEANPTASGSGTTGQDTADSVEGSGPVTDSGVGRTTSSGQIAADREVDDWEEACD
ncbi:NF-X1-type zinc finger protein NFXL1 [Iris pallida]|uniref:NF-X1-type zinc finger protein NFXL1 n=1 Tax=Iris pallida TaxID=29817 RepID=A0AAX6GDV8_IRIPA|nr:NF-X1-type zinc finger protein NFXL1 [Iris pallida]